MKTRFLVLLLSTFFSVVIIAQPNYAYFNTGTSGVFPFPTLAVGNNVSNWTVSGPLPNVAPVVTNPCAFSAPNIPGNGGVTWISYPFNCVPGSPNNHSCIAGTLDLYYSISFTLPANTPYLIDLMIFSGDWLQDITVNSSTAWTNSLPYTNHPLDINAGKPFKWCRWQAGTNTITFHTVSLPSSNPPGLTGDNCAGLMVQSFLQAPSQIFGP
jgi:hypothetical protein